MPGIKPVTHSGLQTITPEEPNARKRILSSPCSPAERSPWVNHSPLESPPSLQNTRDLERSIAETLHELQHHRDSPPDLPKLVSVLNQSLTAISHWSLQAQLSKLENRSARDDRLAVENNLIKKEVEYFRNRCMTASRGTHGSTCECHSQEKLLPPLGDESSINPESSHQRSANAVTSLAETPRRVTKVPRKSTASKRRSSQSQQPQNSSLMRLVENHKSHPRMRRTSDNPSANNFVRVFHLEKL
ncbi:LADA_0F11144g1_1 [Lachancea dasiensis]|uniref:LADA_0F11144g1_1 n=1 Tax=Lachancea dasiensis TaxID=1072105 RepID=A0A1G4JLY7_9SACH|nr:LADA_0F11144g1_1 [Lachancea dasiensis]